MTKSEILRRAREAAAHDYLKSRDGKLTAKAILAGDYDLVDPCIQTAVRALTTAFRPTGDPT